MCILTVVSKTHICAHTQGPAPTYLTQTILRGINYTLAKRPEPWMPQVAVMLLPQHNQFGMA